MLVPFALRINTGINKSCKSRAVMLFSLHGSEEYLKILANDMILVGYVVIDMMKNSFVLEDKSSPVQKHSPFVSLFFVAALETLFRVFS